MKLVIYSILISFTVALFLGPIIIPQLKRLKFGQSIREEGPKSHLRKAGTPTMGGIIFSIATIITMIIIIRNPIDEAMIALYSFIAFGFIGALDDGLKIYRKKNLGLRSYQKMILILIVSTALAFYAAASKTIGTSIIIPFSLKTINLGVWYIPFIIFYYAATTNAVNLTDGIDGLASTVTILVITFFAFVSFVLGHHSLAVFCGALCGALLGFLRFNSYKAKVFMGDLGSLALGGAVAAVAMILKMPIIIIIVGGIYVIEALSVIIQVASFKATGKRVFKMAPIHHHFEHMGWHESKIVAVFSIVTVILCLVGFLSLSL